jgi:ppGpp synthetase/RelA/SpoT-type nucleotidyltranferase
MIVPNQIRAKYEAMSGAIERVSSSVRASVSTYADRNQFAFVGRIKTLESLAEKLETGRFASWAEIDDLYGCVLVVPTLLDEPRVLEFLQSTFDTVVVKARGATKKAPDVFRFESTRFIGRLRPPSESLAKESIYSVQFEVQIRSAFEHAWSATTHALAYKSGNVDWRRLRMAAQLKAAVEQLDGLVLGFEQSAETVVVHEWPELESRNRIAGLFKESVEAGNIPSELSPKDWSRLAENVHSMLRAGNDRRIDLDARVQTALDAIEKEIGRLGAAGMPRSISLFQFALGVCATNRLVGPQMHRFSVLVTPELMTIFPATTSLTPQFALA